MNQTIRIGTRGSQLALWQANHIADLLRASGHAVELEVIRTVGDRMQSKDFVAPQGLSPNGTGIFIKEIEDALLAGRIDLAVHSLKDLPTQITPGLTLAAIPPRADARDAFVCEEHWGLHMLPSGSRVATTSPRRQAMVLALRPDLTFVEMRGNIDTRLRKWSEGEADALILASAGLDRLGRTESVHQRFSVDELTPAPGQGALALQVRCPDSPQHCHSEPPPYFHPEPAQHCHSEPPPYCHPEPKAKDLLLASDDNALNGVDALKGTGFSPSVEGTKEDRALAPEGKGVRDATIHAIIRTLNCPTTEYATQAERAVLHALGGGCQLPLGAYCHRVTTSTNGIEADHWHLHAMIVSPDGEQVVQVLHKAPLSTPATDLGQSVAEALKARGALELLNPEPVISTEA